MNIDKTLAWLGFILLYKSKIRLLDKEQIIFNTDYENLNEVLIDKIFNLRKENTGITYQIKEILKLLKKEGK